jgi:putative ABC transport system substrate-binding protein
VRAQHDEPMRRIGVLMAYAASVSEAQADFAAFREALQNLGWAEGRNIAIEIRWAALDPQAMQQFAKELAALAPDLILSQTTPTTAALLQQTRTIAGARLERVELLLPIIFLNENALGC